MTISGTDIKFSDLQAEFGGSNPISLGEYYRNSSNTTAYLQDNGYEPTTVQNTISSLVGQNPQTALNNNFPSAADKTRILDLNSQNVWIKDSGTWVNIGKITAPHASATNANIPTTGEIKLSQFNGSKEYALTSYSYAGTGGLIYFVNDNGFTAVTGGLWSTRYRKDNVFSFVVPYKGRIRIESVTLGVQGYYDAGGQYDDTDYSEVAYPGFRIRDGSGNEIFSVVGGITPTYDNSTTTTTTSITTGSLAQASVGVTYYIDIFCEGYIGASANPPYVDIGTINFSIAAD